MPNNEGTMSETAVSAPASPQAGRSRRGTGVASARTIRRRRPLPTGRAVVGGFLVAVSSLGVYVAWSGATAGPSERFLVAARDLPVGTRLTATDLRAVAMDLPPSLAARSAFDDAAALEGVKVINPIRAGELVQASALVEAGSSSGESEVSFAIDRSRAVAGTLKPGEHVDVLATFGSGADTYTTTILRAVRVLDVTAGGGALGGSETQVLTVAVATAGDARALAHAVNVAKVTLVRADATGASAEQTNTYRAPAVSDDAAAEG